MDLRCGGIDVQEIHRSVHLHIAVGGGVVGDLNVIVAHGLAAVEFGTLEIEVAALDGALHVAGGVRRGIVNVIAVDIDAGGIVLRDDELRHHDIRFAVVARGEIGFGDAHQRTLDGVAVGVVGGIIFGAVDEVIPFVLFDDESPVGLRSVLARGVAVERVGAVCAVAARKHAQREREREQREQDLFTRFLHTDETPYRSVVLFIARACAQENRPHRPIYLSIISQNNGERN